MAGQATRCNKKEVHLPTWAASAGRPPTLHGEGRADTHAAWDVMALHGEGRADTNAACDVMALSDLFVFELHSPRATAALEHPQLCTPPLRASLPETH